MNTPQDDGGRAFPCAVPHYGPGITAEIQAGMTLRDWFSGMAITCIEGRLGTFDAEEIASRCYQLADAMLAARKEGA